MKKSFKILFITSLLYLSFGQDISGDYRLTGISAVDYDFVRQDTDIMVTDKHSLGITIPGYTFEQGKILEYEYNIPTPELVFNLLGISLNMTLTEGGQAVITDGSTYPTATTENCVTTIQSNAIEGSQGYSSDLNTLVQIPTKDIIGISSVSPYAGIFAGKFSINQSDVFDMIPEITQDISIPFPIDTSSVTGNSGEPIPANQILPETTAGYVLYDRQMQSFIPNETWDAIGQDPTRPSLYIEWHAMDGPVNNSGLGDVIDADEDGDGTDYDRVFGLSSITVTQISSGCDNSMNYRIIGDQTENFRELQKNICIDENLIEDCLSFADDWIETCLTIQNTADTENLYAFSSTTNTIYNGLYTWNSINNINVDDSNYDYDGNSGRIIFEYIPQCIPSFSIRYFMVEMTEQCEDLEKDVCGVCNGEGEIIWYEDTDGDGLGNPDSETISNCFKPEGYVNNNNDLASDCITNDLDDCGVCGGDNSTCSDCSGVPNGSANIDGCGNCTGGNTGQTACEEDCAGVIGGDAEWNLCNICICNNSEQQIGFTCVDQHECIQDCLENWGGVATIDECDVCDADPSNDNTTCTKDCLGIWGGNAIEDTCGECNGEGAKTWYKDEDFDGLGDPSITTVSCIQPNGYVDNNLDAEPECSSNDSDICGVCGGIETDESNCLSIYQNYIPINYIINNSYPNPFNPIITIEYGLPKRSYVDIEILDVNGKFIEKILTGTLNPGLHSITWNADNKSSGIYLFVLKSEKNLLTEKLVLLK